MISFSRIFALYFVIFASVLGHSLMISIFPPMLLHIEESTFFYGNPIGIRYFFLGILLFLYPIGQFIGAPYIERLSDKFGRKPVLTISLLGATLFYAVIAFAILESNYVILAISIFLTGVIESNVLIAHEVIAIAALHKNNNKLISATYVVVSLAYLVGPLLGGRIAGMFTYATPFWCGFFVLLIATLWILVSFDESYIPKKKLKVDGLSRESILSMLKNHSTKPLYIANFLLYFSMFGFFRSISMYIVDAFQAKVTLLSEFLSWFILPMLLIDLYFLRMSQKQWRPRRILAFFPFVMAITMFLVLLPIQTDVLWFTLMMISIPIAFCFPACNSIALLSARGHVKGRAAGNDQVIQFLATAIAALASGLLATIVSSLPLIVFSIAALLGGIMINCVRKTAV
ncbi:MAG: MFS transporter [Chlamydiales bacterium]